jgi:hypothetical protein
MNSRFPKLLSIQWHHMERKVLKRKEDEDKIVNFIGRPFGYITPAKLLPTHSYHHLASVVVVRRMP